MFSLRSYELIKKIENPQKKLKKKNLYKKTTLNESWDLDEFKIEDDFCGSAKRLKVLSSIFLAVRVEKFMTFKWKLMGNIVLENSERFN